MMLLECSNTVEYSSIILVNPSCACKNNLLDCYNIITVIPSECWIYYFCWPPHFY